MTIRVRPCMGCLGAAALLVAVGAAHAQAPAAPAIVRPRTDAPPLRPNARPTPMPPPYFPGARQFLVQPGQNWGHLVAELKPGDELVFPAGFHVPQQVEGLRGTDERPIVLRSRDGIPAAVACAEIGWRFDRCSHLVIENMLFLNPGDAAVIIDGGGPAAQAPGDLRRAAITVRHCTVQGSRGGPAQDGVRVRAATHVTLEAMRFEGWQDAAIELEDVRSAAIRSPMLLPQGALPHARGVRVAGRSAEVAVTGGAFNRSIGIGIELGSEGREAWPVDRARIERCTFDAAGSSIAIRSVRELAIEKCTFLEPRDAVWSVPDDAGTVAAVGIDGCLADWTPGALKRFSPVPDRIPATAFTLGDNLWYSAELPAAWEVLGQPVGFRRVPQVTDVNPEIDPRSLRPRNPEASRFGAMAGLPEGPPLPAASPAAAP